MANAFLVRRGSFSALPPAPGELVIYNGGEDLSGVSGGWIRMSGEGYLTLMEDHIFIQQYGKNYGYREGRFRCNLLQDVTAWSRLKVRCGFSAELADICLFDSAGNTVLSQRVKNGGEVYELDVSALSGGYYPGFYLRSYYDGYTPLDTDLSIYRVWLE